LQTSNALIDASKNGLASGHCTNVPSVPNDADLGELIRLAQVALAVGDRRRARELLYLALGSLLGDVSDGS
jgi:hypothetical protein